MIVIEDSGNNLYIVTESNDPDLAHVYMGTPAKRLSRAETARTGCPFATKDKAMSRLVRRAATREIYCGAGPRA